MVRNVSPFKAQPPKPCENPDCRKTFTPATPWQRACSTPCRMHLRYLEKTKPQREQAKQEGTPEQAPPPAP